MCSRFEGRGSIEDHSVNWYWIGSSENQHNVLGLRLSHHLCLGNKSSLLFAGPGGTFLRAPFVGHCFNCVCTEAVMAQVITGRHNEISSVISALHA